MAQRNTSNLGNNSIGEESPISFAVEGRDQATLDMVKQAVAHKEVVMAFQPIVQSRDASSPPFMKALFGSWMTPGGSFRQRISCRWLKTLNSGDRSIALHWKRACGH